MFKRDLCILDLKDRLGDRRIIASMLFQIRVPNLENDNDLINSEVKSSIIALGKGQIKRFKHWSFVRAKRNLKQWGQQHRRQRTIVNTISLRWNSDLSTCTKFSLKLQCEKTFSELSGLRGPNSKNLLSICLASWWNVPSFCYSQSFMHKNVKNKPEMWFFGAIVRVQSIMQSASQSIN